MATTVIRSGHDDVQDVNFTEVRFDNGDLDALREIMATWNFRNEVSALRFALAALRLTRPGRLCRLSPENQSEVINPNPELLN